MTYAVQYIRRGRTQFQGLFEDTFLVKLTIDLPSIASNGSYSETIAVPGVMPYDMIMGVSSNIDNQRLTRLVHVDTNDTIHFEVHNGTGGPVDLPNAQFYIVIGRPTIDI